MHPYAGKVVAEARFEEGTFGIRKRAVRASLKSLFSSVDSRPLIAVRRVRYSHHLISYSIGFLLIEIIRLFDLKLCL
jgi:hypothetical protein